MRISQRDGDRRTHRTPGGAEVEQAMQEDQAERNAARRRRTDAALIEMNDAVAKPQPAPVLKLAVMLPLQVPDGPA